MDDNAWFSIESKVRKLVKEIIEPTIRRSQESKEVTDKLVRKEEILAEKMSNIEIIVSQTSQRVENLNSFSGKIIESEANLRSLDFKIGGIIDKVYQKIEIVTLDILNLSEKFGVLDKQRVIIEENVAGLEQSLLVTKNSLETNFEDFKERVYKKFENLEGNLRNIDSNIRQINRKIETISADLAETDYMARKADRVTNEHSEKFAQLSKVTQMNRKDTQDNIDKMRTSMFSQYKEFIDSNKKLFKYLENDYKISMNMSFMEHLYSITIDPKAMFRIAQYEKEKLLEWGNHSLQMSMKEAIEKSKARCQTIIDTPLPEKRKIISPTSSKSSLKHIPSKENVKSLSESKPVVVESQIESIGKESESNDSVEPIQNDIVDIRPMSQERNVPSSLTTSLHQPVFHDVMFMPQQYEDLEMVDYMPYIDEVKKLLDDFKSEHASELANIHKIIKTIKSEIEVILNSMKKKQDEFIEAYQRQAKEMELLLSESVHECSMVTNQRKRDLTDMNTSLAEITGRFDRFTAHYEKHEEHSEELLKKLNSIVEICKIFQALQQQDECDRESIALMGYKETKVPSKGNLKKPVISVDKSCLSCTGQNPTILSAFKMACLTYMPSQVMFSSQEFSRKELIDIQRRMIEGIEAVPKTNVLTQAVIAKQKNRAKSAFTVRRQRPSSGPFGGSVATNAEVFSSIASDLPILHKKFQ